MSEEIPQLDDHTLRIQTLFVQHQQAVLAYVLSLEPNVHDAQEIVQETFVTASKKAATFSAGTNFFAWACTMARFNTLHYQRTRSRRKSRVAEDVLDLLAAESEQDQETVQCRVSAMRDCLRRLAPKARELVDRRYHAGKMPDEIADEVGWKANAVRVALSRARKTLRACVEKSELQTR